MPGEPFKRERVRTPLHRAPGELLVRAILSQTSFPPSGDEPGSPALFVDISCPDADTVVVTPAGEADICTIPGLRQALNEAISEGRSHIIVDLDQLTFMDATILRVLVDARRLSTAAGGNLQVRCRNPLGRRLFSITGLDDLVEHPT